MKLNQAHNPGSIELQTKKINARSSKLSDEEILCIESNAIDDLEDQCLHGALKFGFRRVAFDRPQSTPQNMINCAGQVLKVLYKELLRVFSVMGQRLHHTKHLAHVRLWLLEYALQFILMKLSTRFKQLTRSGQGSKLNDVMNFGFMMYVTYHPLKDPSLRIPVVASNVQCGIKQQQKLFVPLLDTNGSSPTSLKQSRDSSGQGSPTMASQSRRLCGKIRSWLYMMQEL